MSPNIINGAHYILNCVGTMSFYRSIHHFHITFFKYAIVYSNKCLVTSIHKLPIMVQR